MVDQELFADESRQERLARYRGARERVLPRSPRDRFEQLVGEALDRLPEFVRERMDNVAVVVEEHPSPEKMQSLGYDPAHEILGLYEGIPRHQRGGNYHLVVPDRITIYRQPILAQVGGRGPAAIVDEIRTTVVHEVAHHFGIDDDELDLLEGRHRRRPHAH